MDRLKHAMSVSSHAKAYGAVLFLDLDHFKILNDTRGHDIGDLLLLEVAGRLQDALREGDSVARLGGDEFVVILESLSKDQKLAMHQAELVADKILSLLAQPYELNGYNYQTSSSIGISLFLDHHDSVEDLLKYADSAMYQAKSAGRGVYRFFDPLMQSALEQRALLEDDLRRAIEQHGELELYYQMQVDRQNVPTGAELLLRWHHPERGMIYPDEFISLAEETGLIVPIGDWILKSAVVQLKVWQEHPLFSHLNLSVNVSEKQFRRADFADKVARLLEMSGVNSSRLKLELTESSMLDNVTDSIAKMDALRQVGVHFALDDFGTGYSSLTYLKQLPLELIKIDQSFVRDIANDPNDAAIVVMIIAMTQALGLQVLAEGVETEAQRNFLEANGCHQYQGYLFSEPVSLNQFEKLLTQGNFPAFSSSQSLP
jgi:diguanylate cyclase (GGDEF)-like protein